MHDKGTNKLLGDIANAKPAARHMTCCCCGAYAGHFQQHWNRDTGFGICRPCAIEHPSHYSENSVGKEGVNWASAEQWDAIIAGGAP